MEALFFLLRRYLFPKGGNMLSRALWISTGGVALGIIQLMLVLAVMSGFQTFLSSHYTRITSDFIVMPKVGSRRHPGFATRLGSVPGVAALSPFFLGQGMVIKDGVGGVVLEGIDTKTTDGVTPWNDVFVDRPNLLDSFPNWIWLGVQLAKKLGVKKGDEVNVMVAEGNEKKIIPFRVTAVTKFGIYDHDLRYARIDLKIHQALFGFSRKEFWYKCRIAKGSNLTETMESVDRTMPFVTVRPWYEIHQNIFLAVEHQKRSLFLILELVVALAAMNIVNLLLMSANYRRRDIAILRAMGMKFSSVFLFFLIQGASVSLVGIGLGVMMGFGVCRLIEKYQPEMLSEAIYNVTRLPLQLDSTDLGIVCAVAFFLCLLFSVVPAAKAALERPVQALRYE